MVTLFGELVIGLIEAVMMDMSIVLMVGLTIVSVAPMWDAVSSAVVVGYIEEERLSSGSGDATMENIRA